MTEIAAIVSGLALVGAGAYAAAGVPGLVLPGLLLFWLGTKE